jgi:DNA (cytosine-5)-methyltransferase 1
MIKIADLFGGIGGFRRGAELYYGEQNVKGVLYCEQDKYAAKTYHANWPLGDDEFYSKDIRDLTKTPSPIADEKYDFDLMFAGFPCQPFSIMGNQQGFEDERGNLFFDLKRILELKRPKGFILENVTRLLTLNKGKYKEAIIKSLKDLGYTVKLEVLNSQDFGVPQVRRRVFFIGVLEPGPSKDLFDEPNSSIQDYVEYRTGSIYPSTYHLLDKTVDQKYYLSDGLIETVMSHGTGGWSAKPEINLLTARPLTKSMHKMHRASQDNYYSDSFIKGTFEKIEVIEQNDQLELALDLPNQVKVKSRVREHSEGVDRIRRLTPIEAFRLQGFDDQFVINARQFGVSDTQLYMQAGNAVTTTVIANILGKYFRMLNIFLK